MNSRDRDQQVEQTKQAGLSREEMIRHLRRVHEVGCLDDPQTTPAQKRGTYDLLRDAGLIRRNTRGGSMAFWDLTAEGRALLGLPNTDSETGAVKANGHAPRTAAGRFIGSS